MGDSINPFSVLGIEETTDREEIVAAYRRLARELHPDRFATADSDERASAEARMAEVNFAYQLLTDERAREQYRRAQQRRRAAGVTVQQPSGPEVPPVRRQPHADGDAETYRRTAAAEFTVGERKPATPWVAKSQRRWFRR